MAGEIQLNSTTMATESSGSITAQLDTIRPNTTNGSLTLQGDSSDAGVTGLTIDSSGVANTTTAKVTNVQATSGQSLTIKDEDGNAAITIGTDNTAASYLSLNFGSYHGGSGTLSANTLDDFEIGTWSPKDGNNALSLTQNSTAYYIKIGDLVNVFFDVTFANPNPTLSQAMYGLPFTPKTGTSCGSTPAKHSTSTTWGMVVVGGSSRFLAWENDGTYQSLSGQTVIATLTYISD
jgi:hypothetical protein